MEYIQRLNNGLLGIKPMSVWRALGFLIIMMVLESLLYIPVQMIYVGLESLGSDYHYYFSIVGEVAVKIILFYWVIKRFCQASEERTSPLTNANGIFWLILIMVGCRLFYNQSVGPLLESFIAMDPLLMEAFDDLLAIPWIGLVSILIIAPVFEEIIFRGVVMKGLMGKTTPSLAIFFSALFFALYHMSLLQGINAFYIGLIIGVIYHMTDSIYWAMGAHFLNNAYVMFVGDMTYMLGGPLGFWSSVFIAFAGAVILYIGFVNLNKMTQKNRFV